MKMSITSTTVIVTPPSSHHRRHYSIFNFIVIAIGVILNTVRSDEVRISNVADLIQFSNSVNTGASYSGTTIYLDSDIDLSGVPSTQIGTDKMHSFNGTFDGQGYSISNLILNSTQQHVGLFGYSTGTTIRNVIVDKSCSITSSLSQDDTSYAHVGSVMGCCDAEDGLCKIENTVSMANVSFGGEVQDGYLHLGGVVGHLSAYSSYSVTMKNCANYGAVTNMGTFSCGYIGGVAGYCGGINSTVLCSIYNSVNHGTVSNAVASQTAYVGGIAGTAYKYPLFANCVNTGELIKQQSGSIGAFVGLVNSTLYIGINDCLCTGNYDIYGDSVSMTGISTPGSLTSIELTPSIVSEHNKRAKTNIGWNGWIFNPNNNTVTFTINGGRGVSFDSHLILLPDLAGDTSRTFSGWFTDAALSTEFTSENVTNDTALYGGWICTVTFIFENDVLEVVNVTYGKPYNIFFDTNTPKKGYSVKWYTEENGGGDEVALDTIVKTVKSRTLYGCLTPNKYVATFDFSNGTVLSELVEYNTTINFPTSIAAREGHSFNGWNNSGISRMPAYNVTFVANWTETVESGSGSASVSSYSFLSEYVEIVFYKKDLSEDKIKAIIERCADGDDYELRIIARDDATITVIVRFDDIEAAKNFVDIINAGSNSFSGAVKKVEFVTESAFSFVSTALTSLFFVLFNI